MAALTVGDMAPDFRLPDAEGSEVGLADFAGQRVILYVYPAALTPGCTTQAVDFSAASPDLDAAGYSVIGISPDTADTVRRFAESSHVTITLLCDPEHQVIEAYGAWGERMLWGKALIGVIRSTFVIDVDATGVGTILQAHYGVRATGHVQRLRATLGI